jgi:hypothetical protein
MNEDLKKLPVGLIAILVVHALVSIVTKVVYQVRLARLSCKNSPLLPYSTTDQGCKS